MENPNELIEVTITRPGNRKSEMLLTEGEAQMVEDLLRIIYRRAHG